MTPAPGGIPLRPLGLGEIFSGAFGLIRKNPAATLGLIGLGDLIGIAFLIVGAVIAATTGSRAIVYVFYALQILISFTVLGGLTAASGRAYLGQKISIREAIRQSRLGWFILVYLMYWLMIAAVWVVPLLLLHGFGVPISLVLGAWLGISFCLSFPSVVLERRGPISAMGRSWQLVRGSFWRIFGIFLLMGIIVIVIFFMLALIFDVVAFLILGSGFSGPTSTNITTGALIVTIIALFIFEILLGGLITALGTGIIVLLFADMRMRKEGLDLVLQQAVLTGQLTGEEFAVASPGAGPGGGGFTGPPGAPYPGMPPAF
jgi:hypothetical protein